MTEPGGNWESEPTFTKGINASILPLIDAQNGARRDHLLKLRAAGAAPFALLGVHVLAGRALVFGLFTACWGQNGAGRLNRAHPLAGDRPDVFLLVEGFGAGTGSLALHATLRMQGGHMRSLGMPEILIILAVAILLFGGKKIPELAKGLGQGIRNFKESLKGDDQPPTPDEKKQA
jgi:sec-independent protein translocase protein TatA